MLAIKQAAFQKETQLRKQQHSRYAVEVLAAQIPRLELYASLKVRVNRADCRHGPCMQVCTSLHFAFYNAEWAVFKRSFSYSGKLEDKLDLMYPLHLFCRAQTESITSIDMHYSNSNPLCDCKYQHAL